MLVFVSDLHLTDGTSGETIRAGAFRIFRERLRDLAYDASWRADGKYRPIERLDLVLLGDILDVIRSDKWLTGSVRPWDDPQGRQFTNKVRTITEAILARNKESLDCLKSLHEPNLFTIPRATRAGQPMKAGRDLDASNRVPVEVGMYYMVGNHDWFYHLPGTAYNAIRRRIVDAIGLSGSPAEPFAHDPGESPAIEDLFRRHRVFARHGDIFDPFNYEADRDASSLGDAIVVELLNRFPTAVRERMGNDLPADCLDGLKEIDNVRPLLVIPAWVDGLLRRTCSSTGQADAVRAIWDETTDEFLSVPFVRAHDRRFRIDLVDMLEAGFKLSAGLSLRSLDRLLSRWSGRHRGRERPSYRDALTERTFKNRAARYVVYGHTHRHKAIPLDSCHTSQGPLDQMYVNTGTWRRVHERTRWRPREQEFIGYAVMTYVAFLADGERGGRAFESWSGALG